MSRFFANALILALPFVCIASPVAAHEGHALPAVPGNSISHYLMSPEHFGGMLMVGLIAIVVVSMWRSASRHAEVA